jgi:hypothetical protein
MRSLLRNRIALCYLLIAGGALLFAARRLVLPTFFEQEGLPFVIAAPSILNSCYSAPTLAKCSDPAIVLATIVGVTLVTGWGHPVALIFALILAILPTLLYLLLGPIVIVLGFLLIIPIIVRLGMRLFFPSLEP